MKRKALLSAFCALLFANLLAAADANDVERLAGQCAAGDQKACGKLRAAIRKLTDQTVLAKIAVEHKDAKVREAAVWRLKDQTLLAKIAVEDHDNNVRESALNDVTDQAALARALLECDGWGCRRALEKLTDQAALAKLALEAKDDRVRDSAARKLIDQAMLAKVAIASKSQPASFDAVGKLTDKALLEKVAAEATDRHVREDAVAKLDEQAVLAKAAKEVEDRSLRAQAIAAMNPSDPNLKLMAYLSVPTSDPMLTAARIRLAIQEPRIRNRFPLIVFEPRISLKSHSYFGIRKGGSMPGESITFELRQAGKTLAQKNWSTVFPQQMWEFVFLAAHVDGTDLLRELLRNAVFTPDDLAELSSSEIPELRQAAQERLAQIRANAR